MRGRAREEERKSVSVSREREGKVNSPWNIVHIQLMYFGCYYDTQAQDFIYLFIHPLSLLASLGQGVSDGQACCLQCVCS